MAGLETPISSTPGRSLLALTKTPEGEQLWASYSEIYRTNPWVFACVQVIARGLSRMPVKVYQLDKDGQRSRVRGDLPGQQGAPSAGVLLDRLLSVPEPEINTGVQTWLRKIIIDRAIFGNALVVKERNSSGRIIALWHIPWSRVTVVPGENTPILKYTVGAFNSPDSVALTSSSNGGNTRDFSPLDVIHFGRGTNLDKPYGASPLASLKYTLALHNAIQRHLVAYFENQARPSGVLKVQPNTNDKQIDQMRKEIRRLYSAPESAGKVMITSAEFQAITEAPSQSAVIELAKHSREEIAAAFAIPPPVVGILDRAIMSNVRDLRSQLVRDVIGSWASEVEDDFAAQLLTEPQFSGFFVEFDLAEALRPDLEARADVFAKMRHVYTPDEMRAIENLPELGEEGSDTVWMPAGQIGLGLQPAAPLETPVQGGPKPLEAEGEQGAGTSDTPDTTGELQGEDPPV
jgi:HK97 family phage portal protein